MDILAKLDMEGISAGAVIDAGLGALLRAIPSPADLSVPSLVTLAAPQTLPAVLGATVTGPVTIWATRSGTLTIGLNSATLTLPPAVTTAFRTETGTGRRRRVHYAGAGQNVELQAAGDIRIVLAAGSAAAVDVSELSLRPLTRLVLLPGGMGLMLPETIRAEGGRFMMVGTEFVLPEAIPVIGGVACQVDLQCGVGRLDLDLDVQPAPVADGENAPAIGGTLSWHLPDAESFEQLVPSGGSVTLDLPTGAGLLGPAGPAIDTPLRVRAGMSRPPDNPGAISVTVTMESDAPSGLLRVFDSGPGAIAAGITTVLAPAIVAAAPAASTVDLFAAAAVIGTELAAKGGFTLHAVTLDASTEHPGTVHALLDVEGLVTAKLWESGPVAVGMRADARPMRVRWRDVSAIVNPTQDPGEMLTLDFSRARIEVVDPGDWTVKTPGSLLDIVGTRSGHGSTWFEIDLRFVADLGPVTISGATVRATFRDGDIALGLRGLTASVDVAGVVSGEGQMSFTDTGFSVVLGVQVPPVGLAALGFLRYDDLPQGRKVEIGFAVDLPGPIPLGPTGLGLYGALGAFGHNARMPALNPENPFRDLRKWKPWQALAFGGGDVTIGLGVSIGTAPDNGFFFNSLGVLGMTLPAFDLRIGLDGTLLAERKTLTRSALEELEPRATGGEPPAGAEITVFGGVAATTDALDVALIGSYSIPYLVNANVPLAAHFPFRSADWWVRTGSDDGILAPTNRPPGPISARVFPGTPFECGGWAFLMVHGAGINSPSLLGDPATPATTGFTIGAGAGIEVVIGAKGLLWAEITARLAALISTRPQLLFVRGRVGGTLGIGPFHIGLSAEVTLQIWPGPAGDIRFAYKLDICGEIDLFFDTLRKCITVNTLDAAPAPLPPVPGPDDWPWPDVLLADGLGRSLPAAVGGAGQPQRPGTGSGDSPDGGWAKAPVIWPDVVPILAFPIAPAVGTAAITAPAPSLNLGEVSSGGATITWTLQDVVLEDVTSPAAVTSVPLQATSRWQVPAGTGTWPAGTSNARELVLLRRTLLAWAAHMAGDGTHLKPMMDPAQLIGGACLWTAPAGPGWSVGADAIPLSGPSWHVPAEQSEAGTGSVSGFANGTGFTVASRPLAVLGQPARRLPPITIPAGVTTLPAEAVAEDRRFERALRLTSSLFPVQEAPLSMRTTITLDEPVVGGWLHLLITAPDDFLPGRDDIIASARTINGATNDLPLTAGDRSADGSGIVLTVTLPPSTADPATAILLTLPWRLPVSILGLLSTTARDDTRAAKASDAQQASNGDDARTSADPSKLTQLLTPGHRYRLRVTLGWDSALNVPGVPASQADSGPEPVLRSWYFATAGKDPNPPAKPATPQKVTELVKAGTASGYSSSWKLAESAAPVRSAAAAFVEPHLAASFLLDTFKPGYLARYLKGFTPADHTEFLFPSDHPGVEFLAMHIVELAGLYGRDVGLLLHRVDKPAEDIYTVPFPQPAKSKPRLALAAAVGLAARNAGCVTPPTESTLTLPQELEKGASYELSCVLPEAGEAHPGQWTPSIGGITFTTSNFKGPADLLYSFGFRPLLYGPIFGLGDLPPSSIFGAGPRGAARAHGDLPVTAFPAAAGRVQDDAELEHVIHALGLPPLRPVQANRSGLLWAPAGNEWALAGLLLESTEPLVREGSRRMGIRQVSLAGAELPVCRLNRAGTVALWLATTPLTVTSTAALEILATDRLTDFRCRITVKNPPRFTSATLTVEEP